MATTPNALKARLLESLKESDEYLREQRADRIIWVSDHRGPSGAMVGPPETITLLSEVEDAFREGHFISVQLLALAFVEHALVDTLVGRNLIKKSQPLAGLIEAARESQILDSKLLDRIDALREIRNPFAHRRNPNDPNTYGNRYIKQQTHPRALLERDAREAFQVMHLVRCSI